MPLARPEQRQTEHDRSTLFSAPAPSSPVLDQQPDKGRETGFDFARDPLNAKRPMQTFEEVMKADVAEKPGGDGRAAEAAGEPVRPDAEARPQCQDVARQAAARRPDGRLPAGA